MRELGREVVLHRGRWWVRVVPGFYQPVHLLARMRPDEATRPTLRCWGLRASLAPESAASANGSIPAHVLPDPRSYDAGRLAPSQRRKLRKHLPEFDVVALDRPDILLEQGYPIMREAHARNRRVPLPGRRQFERWVASYFSPRRGLVLAAFRHGRLLAFNTNSAVDGVAYGDTAYANAEGRRYALTTGLFHAFATVVSRSAQASILWSTASTPARTVACATSSTRSGFASRTSRRRSGSRGRRHPSSATPCRTPTTALPGAGSR